MRISNIAILSLAASVIFAGVNSSATPTALPASFDSKTLGQYSEGGASGHFVLNLPVEASFTKSMLSISKRVFADNQAESIAKRIWPSLGRKLAKNCEVKELQIVAPELSAITSIVSGSIEVTPEFKPEGS